MKKHMKLYRYLTGTDDAAFCARVTQALNKGWTLHGAPTMAFNGAQIIVGQVLCKEIEQSYNDDTDILATLKANS